MIELKEQQLKHLRRTVVSAQGLLNFKPYGQGLAGTVSAVKHLGYIQLDSISVIERAHHHVLYSRVPGYKPDMLEQLMQGGDIFEYWAHAAAVLPMSDFRYSLPYKHSIKSGQTHWYKSPDKKLMRELLARIRSDGPLRSRDVKLQAEKGGNKTGWWDWKPAKRALEQLYMQGDLMVCARTGFQKTYDLTERVLPPQADTSMPTVNEWADHLLNQQLRSHGLVSLKGITYLRRNAELKSAVKALVYERLSQGTLQQIQLPDDSMYLMAADAFENPMPRVKNTLRILSPFDNAVIQRERLKDLFGFNYQLECYVPASKRRYGYFSLPMLYRDEFVGLMDCKAHRKERLFEIKSLHLQSDLKDYDSFMKALLSALHEFKIFQGCEDLVVKDVFPNDLKCLFNKALI